MTTGFCPINDAFTRWDETTELYHGIRKNASIIKKKIRLSKRSAGTGRRIPRCLVLPARTGMGRHKRDLPGGPGGWEHMGPPGGPPHVFPPPPPSAILVCAGPCRPVPVFPAGVSAGLPFRVGGRVRLPGEAAGAGGRWRLYEGKKPGRGVKAGNGDSPAGGLPSPAGLLVFDGWAKPEALRCRLHPSSIRGVPRIRA
jgi:hypothetical protein